MVLIKCGWCEHEFNRTIYIDKFEERIILMCPKCHHQLASSKKIPTGQLVGRKHIHEEYQDGDTAI